MAIDLSVPAGGFAAAGFAALAAALAGRFLSGSSPDRPLGLVLQPYLVKLESSLVVGFFGAVLVSSS
ncbi:hypothetical protein ACLQ25_32205, partial [Micromonospora sp. DT44]|uniref:hypothetical protein n=1 Tax=Micromonospora sp. DT44 TaxID=3393439 RepID=UPI003CEF9236